MAKKPSKAQEQMIHDDNPGTIAMVQTGEKQGVEFRSAAFKDIQEMHALIHEAADEMGPAVARIGLAKMQADKDTAEGLERMRKTMKKDEQFRAGFIAAINLAVAHAIENMTQSSLGAMTASPADLGDSYADAVSASFLKGIDIVTDISGLLYLVEEMKVDVAFPRRVIDASAHISLMPLAGRYIGATKVPEGATVN